MRYCEGQHTCVLEDGHKGIHVTGTHLRTLALVLNLQSESSSDSGTRYTPSDGYRLWQGPICKMVVKVNGDIKTRTGEEIWRLLLGDQVARVHRIMQGLQDQSDIDAVLELTTESDVDSIDLPDDDYLAEIKRIIADEVFDIMLSLRDAGELTQERLVDGILANGPISDLIAEYGEASNLFQTNEEQK